MSANAQEEETRRARPAAELLRCEASPLAEHQQRWSGPHTLLLCSVPSSGVSHSSSGQFSLCSSRFPHRFVQSPPPPVLHCTTLPTI